MEVEKWITVVQRQKYLRGKGERMGIREEREQEETMRAERKLNLDFPLSGPVLFH